MMAFESLYKGVDTTTYFLTKFVFEADSDKTYKERYRSDYS